MFYALAIRFLIFVFRMKLILFNSLFYIVLIFSTPNSIHAADTLAFFGVSSVILLDKVISLDPD